MASMPGCSLFVNVTSSGWYCVLIRRKGVSFCHSTVMVKYIGFSRVRIRVIVRIRLISGLVFTARAMLARSCSDRVGVALPGME